MIYDKRNPNDETGGWVTCVGDVDNPERARFVSIQAHKSEGLSPSAVWARWAQTSDRPSREPRQALFHQSQQHPDNVTRLNAFVLDLSAQLR